MTTQTEALKLALEALSKSDDFLFDWHENESDNEADAYATARQLNEKAITAIKEALAQQCVCGEPNSAGTHRTDGPCFAPQPEQEPIGFLTNHRQRWNFVANGTGWASMPMTIDWKIPLYTTPPQRKPLTVEQRNEIARQADENDWHDYDIIDAVEAAHGIKE